MAIQHQDDLSLQSLKKDLQEYNKERCLVDLVAGFNVALITVPQALAYSLVASLPLSCGLLAAIFATLVAALFGSSRQLVVGPNNAISMLVLYATSEVLFTHYREVTGSEKDILAIQILTQLALLVAIMQILAATFKLGRLIQFVSHSVVVGYLAATMIALIINQLFTFLGLPMSQGFLSLYEKCIYLLSHLGNVHLPTLLIGLGSVGLLVFLNRLNKKIPAAVITLILAGIAVHFLGLTAYSDANFLSYYSEKEIGNVTIVGDRGEIQGMFPHFRAPSFSTSLMNQLLPYAFVIALLSILETTSIAKSIAIATGQRLSINQEILGLGLGNLASAFTGSLISSGSATRSSINLKNGAKTRMAAIFSSLFVALIVFSFGFFISLTPLPALSALLLVSSKNIVNFKQFFLCLKATSHDAIVIVATLLSCLFFSLDIAFYIGILFSISLYLQKAAVPKLQEYNYDDFFMASDRKEMKKLIRVINVQGELFFGAADLFQSTLKSIAEDDNSLKVIILRLQDARDIDATACLAIEQLYEYLKGSNRALLACGLNLNSWETLCNAGLVQKMGKENLFILNEDRPKETLKKALERAKKIITHTNVIETTLKEFAVFQDVSQRASLEK